MVQKAGPVRITLPGEPFLNFTASDFNPNLDSMAGTQIFELGNSLGQLTNSTDTEFAGFVGSTYSVDEGSRKEQGNRLRACYEIRSFQAELPQ